MTGVIPDPPAMPTRWRCLDGSKSVVKLPCGTITSTVSPGFSWSPTQLEKRPPPMRFTVTIQSLSAGAVQSE